MSIKENIKLEILKRLKGGKAIDNLTKEYSVSRSFIISEEVITFLNL